MATQKTQDTETTDSTTEGQQAEALTPEPVEEPVKEPSSESSAVTDTTADADASDDLDSFDEEEDELLEAGADRPSGGFAAGAGAIVSAALGLCSLTGTSVGEMLHSRKELIGQIESSSGGGSGGDQIDAFYSAPWHTAALINGIFALVALVVGGVLLAVHAQRADTRSWVKGVALGGVILGAVGLLVSGGMYLDLFASPPELP